MATARRGGRFVLPIALVCTLLGACRDEHNAGRLVDGGDPDVGAPAIVRYGCGSCHVIPGIPGATGKVGAPLTSFADRVYIAGAVTNTADNLVAWIMNPNEIEPGTAMPNLGVSSEEARHIAAYLYTLGDGAGLGPPHLFPMRWLRALKGEK